MPHGNIHITFNKLLQEQFPFTSISGLMTPTSSSVGKVIN